ncbi:MAG: helix-turn-helix transcriptional regulator, partial [Rhodocyclaceae bacterium]|nr:helix-turn-helix transcriptional regulator [Rhodocyclaceae bacterium]
IPLIKCDKVVTPQKSSEILEILSYINQNLAENISVEDIASKFGMSQTTLWHIMKETLAISPKAYLLKTRLAKASELLIQGASVTEAAEKTGFNSYAHFIRIFTKYMGTPPYKYGKNN